MLRFHNYSWPKQDIRDVYDVQKINEDQVVLVKLQHPPPKQAKKRDVLQAISKFPLHPTKSWEKLKKFTREP